MNVYSAEQPSRQALTVFVLFVGLVATTAALVVLGWWMWDNLINNPLPYRDPEAMRAVTTIAQR